MPKPNQDSATLALRALCWILSDGNRAERLLALTGIQPDDLRDRLDDPTMLDAALSFIEGQQADLIACAAALSVPPAALVAARHDLMPQMDYNND